MTPAEFRAVRHALGLSAQSMARLVGIDTGRTVRRWEAGDSEIPGPVVRLLEAAHEVPDLIEWLRARAALNRSP